MKFKKLALVSLASVAVLGAAQQVVHADDTASTSETSDAVKSAQAKVDAAKATVAAKEQQLALGQKTVTDTQTAIANKAAKVQEAEQAVTTAQANLTAANANLAEVTSSTNPQAQAWKADADRKVAAATADLEAAQAQLQNANAIIIPDLVAVNEMVARYQDELAQAQSALEAANTELATAVQNAANAAKPVEKPASPDTTPTQPSKPVEDKTPEVKNAEDAVAKAQADLDAANKNLAEVTSSTNPQAQGWKADAERRVATAKEALKKAQDALEAAKGGKHEVGEANVEPALPVGVTPEEEAVTKAQADLDAANKNLSEVTSSTNPQAQGWKADAERRVATAKEALKKAQDALEAAKGGKHEVGEANVEPALPVGVTPEEEAVAKAQADLDKAKKNLEAVTSSTNPQAANWKADADRLVANAQAALKKAQDALEAAKGGKHEVGEPATEAALLEGVVNEEKVAEEEYEKAAEKEYENLTANQPSEVKPVEVQPTEDKPVVSVLGAVEDKPSMDQALPTEEKEAEDKYNKETEDAYAALTNTESETAVTPEKSAEVKAAEEAVEKAKADLDAANKLLAEVTSSTNPQAEGWKADAERRVAEATAALKAAEDALAKLQPAETPVEKASVTAKIVDQDGNPVQGAKVEFLMGNEGRQPGPSNEKGEVVLDGVEVGTAVKVTVFELPEGFKEATAEANVVVIAGGVEVPFEVERLKPVAEKSTVKVRVVDNATNPVAGAKVEFTTDEFSSGHQVDTDKDGYASFEAEVGAKVQARLSSLPEGYDSNDFKVSLTAEKDKVNEDFIIVNKQVTATANPEDGVKNNQDALPALTVIRVVDNGSNPVAGADVEFSTDGFLTGHQVKTDANGYAVFEVKDGDKVQARLASVPEGYAYNAYVETINVTADGANSGFIAVDKTAVSTNNPTDGGNNTQEALPALTVIRVVDNGSSPVVGADVEFSTDGFSTGHQVKTDADGYAVFEAKDGDKVQVRLASVPEGYAYNAYVETINVTATGSNSGFIAVDKTTVSTNNPTDGGNNTQDALPTVVSVVVKDNASNPVKGAVVKFTTDDPEDTFEVLTDENGLAFYPIESGKTVKAQLSSVPAGYEKNAYVETIKAEANGDNAGTIFVDKKQDDTPAPTPIAKDATLIITVVSEGKAQQGVAVDVMVNGKVVNVGTTDANGQVVVKAKEGDKVDYRLASVPEGFVAPEPGSATLKAGENKVQVTVNRAEVPNPDKPKPETPTEEATFTLSVIDKASKAPLSGVAIDLIVAGKVTTVTTDGKGQVTVSAKAGDVVKYRVAMTPKGYKANTMVYDATLVKGENTATLALEADGTMPTPTPTPQPQPTPEKKDDGKDKPDTDKKDDGMVKPDSDKKADGKAKVDGDKDKKDKEDKKVQPKTSAMTKSADKKAPAKAAAKSMDKAQLPNTGSEEHQVAAATGIFGLFAAIFGFAFAGRKERKH